ncbi:MAG TPA: hypothetical protein VK813_16355 [Edaphobacter sp.]|jgi:hypothetical protein|nr:hypothetical protein [Edaphobacter sp.]
MNLRQSAYLTAIAAFTLGLTACGGGGGSTPPPPAVTVSLSGQPASLAPNGTASITATASNGATVTWSVTCATSPCGTFSSPTTASGAPNTYTAPSAPTTVTITASVGSGTPGTAQISIAVPPISVAFNPAPPTSLPAGTTTPLTAVVSNDSKSAGVTWTVTCGSSGACGSFNPTSTASGTATTYTAPAAIPTGNTVAVTATSVTDPTKSQSATITIGAPPAVLANGTYVYHFSGWDNNGPSFFAGAFTVAGGVITGGEQDFSDPATIDPAQPLVASQCSLSTVGGNIQIVLATADTSLGVNGLETLRGTVVSSTRVLISEYDTFGTGTGSIDLQTSAAAPSGGYAFAISGWYSTTTANTPLAIGGVLNISGSTISITGSVFDFNLGGTVGQALQFTTGSTVSAPDSFGRVTFTLVPTSTSNVPSFILTGYIVGTNQIQIIESQTDTLSADLGGTALGQGSNTGSFNLTSIASKTYVFAAAGADVNNPLATYAGSFAFNSSGGLAGNLTINDFTYFSGNTPSTLAGGSYTVDPTGRVTISNVNAQPADATFTFQLYLDGNGNALELGADSEEVTEGPAYLQSNTSADFEGSYALVGQGILNSSPTFPAWGAVGPVTVSSDNINGSTDYNEQGVTPSQAVALTGTETNSTGVLSITGLDALAFTSPRSYNYIPIDNKRVFAIENDGLSQSLLTLETVSH